MSFNRPTQLYVTALVVLAAIVLYAVLHEVIQTQSFDYIVVPLIVFTVIAAITQIYEVELVFGRSMSTGNAFFIATILLGGISLAILTMAISAFISEVILRYQALRKNPSRFILIILFNTAQITVTAFVASMVFYLLGGSSISPDLSEGVISNIDSIVPIVAAVAAFLSYSVLNNALVSGMVSLVRKTNFTYHLRFNIQYLLVQILSLGVLGILIAEVYSHSPFNILLVLIPMGLVHVSLRNYMKLRHEAQNTFEIVANMLSERDPYTYEHSEQVEDLSEKIARVMHFSEDEIADIRAGALIHDIGKLAVPDRILLKPGPLTAEERLEMEKHPVIGAQLLENLEIYKDIVDIVRHEHEKWDGTGYPDGLKGEEIPMGARIIAAADIYNALTTDRPYRKAYSHEKAVAIIQDSRGSHLDPTVVDALLHTLGELDAEPQPLVERVIETAIPFSPVFIVLLILMASLVIGLPT